MNANDSQKLLLHALIEAEGDRFSALCLELDVATEGQMAAEAVTNLREAVGGYLTTVFTHGLEDELFPRLAPRAQWRRFFQAQAKTGRTADAVELQEVAYA